MMIRFPFNSLFEMQTKTATAVISADVRYALSILYLRCPGGFLFLFVRFSCNAFNSLFEMRRRIAHMLLFLCMDIFQFSI